MENVVAFTNNPVATDFIKNKFPTVNINWLKYPSLEVLTITRSAVRKGAILLSNPLVGIYEPQMVFAQTPICTVVPKRAEAISPFITLILSQLNETIDFSSAKKLDETIDFYKKNARLRFIPHKEDDFKRFQVRDLESITATLSKL